MGRLLVHCGEVDQRTMHKYASRALEWLCVPPEWLCMALSATECI